MELSIKDRIYIPQMLPKQGKFTEFNLKRGIIGKVAITEKDRKDYSIEEDKEKGQIKWDVKKDIEMPLVVDLTKEELEYLRASCELLVDASYPDDFWFTVEKIYDAAQ